MTERWLACERLCQPQTREPGNSKGRDVLE
jgi:hypothetical protein